MKLYLVQHGEIMAPSEGPEGGLSAQGWDDVTQSAELAARLGVRPVEVLHDGVLRDLETADILARRFQSPSAQGRGLGDLGAVEDWVGRLNAEQRDLLIVSRQPFLERLCSSLLTGSPTMEVVQFPKGGIICLERENDGQWQFLWAIWPEMARGLQPAIPI